MHQLTTLDMAVAALAPATPQPNGAALGAQTLVEHKACRHERRGKQDIPAVLLRIRQDLLVRAEQEQDLILIRKAEDQHKRPKREREEEAGGEHLAGALVLLRAEQTRRKARRAHGEEPFTPTAPVASVPS